MVCECCGPRIGQCTLYITRMEAFVFDWPSVPRMAVPRMADGTGIQQSLTAQDAQVPKGLAVMLKNHNAVRRVGRLSMKTRRLSRTRRHPSKP